MDKREACHRLAEINEGIYDLTISLEKKDELLEKCKMEVRLSTVFGK